MRRIKFPRNQFIGDTTTHIVHDLDREDCSENGCRINESIMKGNIKTFEPDRLPEAHWQGFVNCPHCLGDSIRLEAGL